MTKKKDKQKKMMIYSAIVIIVIILALGSYLYLKGEKIREGETIEACGEGTTIYLDEDICWQESTKPKNSENWADANTYCEGLMLAEHDDWRLPTKEELASIVDQAYSEELAINPNVFKDTESKHYWTSEEYAQGIHWYVHFEIGHQGYAQDFNEGYGVRCVRDIIFY